MNSMMYKRDMKFFLFFLPFLLFFLCACKHKDFSINSDSEPFTVIYGLLNSSDKQHHVKIFKSFVVEGNAYDVVKDIYKYSYIDSVDVYLNEYDSKRNLIRKIPLDTTTAILKDSGLFLYPTQISYVADAVLNKGYLYEIEVFNPYTKTVAKVKTLLSLAGNVNIIKPNGSDISITDRPLVIDFYSAEHSSMYQLMLKFYYTERLIDDSERQPEPVVWILGNLNDNETSAGVEKKLSITSGAPFFMKVAEKIQNNDNIKLRHTDSIVLEVHSAGKDWDLYIKSNLPTWGINQDKLYYSNIKAYNTETGEEKYATGIFSSRGITTKKYNNLSINGSRDSLFMGRYTGHLKFTDIY